MTGNILISGATMVLPDTTKLGDLRITDGIITEVSDPGTLDSHEGEMFVDGTGLHLLPGCIDPQVHFRDPGQPEKEDLGSGSAAAVSGGITSFLDMPNNVPSITNLEGMQGKLDTAAKKCVNNYGFFIGATEDNVADLQEVVGTKDKPIAIPGICGIKIFMGVSTGTLLVSDKVALEKIFTETAGLIAVHAEDEDRMNERRKLIEGRTDVAAHAYYRDDITALLATKLSVELAIKTGHRLHILHLTSGIEADYLADYCTLPSKAEQHPIITTEVLPQHLTFDETDVDEQGVRLQMNPPIRYAADRDILWSRLRDGTIQCIATDHAPHTLEDKAKGFPKAPSGMPGVETSLSVMLTNVNDGMCSLEDVVRWMSTDVADCYQMIGKGKLEVGYDGDIVLVDMAAKAVVEDENSWARVGWNPFRGRELTGWPVLTVVDGIPVFERSSVTGQKGRLLVEPGSVGKPIVMKPWN
ncbi:MAG TPA: dihydroorotase [Candidatus Poseidoniales archaeon]|nr:MAG TPA: dihydroorotase [Candidatus Poseidoniales archaeon]HII58256.1 dihydroorotase [Candidatus Poseidoniaceae archaeon]|tara:strand:- start:815 stop:2221 length:1407 start_codon:yes stop_codon:yes gene_type:complete